MKIAIERIIEEPVMSNEKEILKRGLKNRDENLRLIRWMLRVVRPYYRYVICVFCISIVSMLISYGSTILG